MKWPGMMNIYDGNDENEEMNEIDFDNSNEIEE